MTMMQEEPRGMYFEAHELVAETTRAYTVQANRVARIRQRLAREQAKLAVMGLEIMDLEDAERQALG